MVKAAVWTKIHSETLSYMPSRYIYKYFNIGIISFRMEKLYQPPYHFDYGDSIVTKVTLTKTPTPAWELPK